MLIRRVCYAVVSVVALALQVSAAVFVQPPVSGSAPSGIAWSAVATGTALPVRSSGSANGFAGAVAYFDTVSGQVQIDPKGWDISLFNLTYTSGTTNTVGTTPGPLQYSSGTAPTTQAVSDAFGTQRSLPAGAWATITVSPSRIAATVSLTASPSLATSYATGNGAANGTSPYATNPAGAASTPGWFNQPWAFPADLVNSGSVASMTNANWKVFGVSGQANANILGYGNYQGVFNYTINGVTGQQIGAMIPVVPEPSTYAMLGAASVAIGFICRRRTIRGVAGR